MNCFGFHCTVKSTTLVEINKFDEYCTPTIQKFVTKEICRKFLHILIPEYDQSNAPYGHRDFEILKLLLHKC